MSIAWQLFPRNLKSSQHIPNLVEVFESSVSTIGTPDNQLNSNDVLEEVRPGLTAIGYEVEAPGPPRVKVRRPVLFGRNGKVEQYFDVDAFQSDTGTVVEVEAGRAVINHQFLKDLFEACAMQDVKYLCIAVANEYKSNPNAKPAKDFDKVVRFFETLYASDRMTLPFIGVLIVGY